MSSNLSGNRAVAEARRDGFGRLIGYIAKKARVPNFNFVSQWSTLAVGDGGMARRRRGAGFFQRGNRNFGKSGLAQFIPNQFKIMISVGSSGEKTRRSSGNTEAAASVTTSANSFVSILSQTLKMKLPPGLSTRRASA